MRIWLDADNIPHVHVIRALTREFENRGHSLLFTARKRAFTCELMDYYGFNYTIAGKGSRSSLLGKVTSVLLRAYALARIMRNSGVDVSFGHGSRSLPLASKWLGIPSVTMFDYEWVDTRVYNRFCNTILLPDVIKKDQCIKAGIDVSRVVFFSGLKEEIYLSERTSETDVPEILGLRKDAIHILFRPPATTAHYHDRKAEEIMKVVFAMLSKVENLQVIYLPRTPGQIEVARKKTGIEMIVPDIVLDGPSLIEASDLVIGGGGTITREAAVLGVPSFSFFTGQEGMVDQSLEKQGKLIHLREPEDVQSKLIVKKRQKKSTAIDSGDTVGFIVDRIIDAAGLRIQLEKSCLSEVTAIHGE